ncbi:MAG: alginate export family protein [Planctomycetes bacterium]|nr:alginate export family protein [Planctomycetota bacterium]
MYRRHTTVLLVSISVVSFIGSSTNAQTSPPEFATSQPAASEEGPTTSGPADSHDSPTASPSVPKAGPKYLLLRYNEDFSYLDGEPDTYNSDIFDPIKNIHLDDDWRLRLGGEIRFRMESETNRNFGARDPTNDTFLLYRELLHADFHYRNTFRIFVEGIDARVADRNLPQIPGMENTFDVHQAFADIRLLGEQTPLTLRIGRQEMIYGKERVIGKLDWMNEGRRFDGAKLMYASPKFDIDFFWVKPVFFMNKPFSNPWNTHINEGMNHKIDHWREEQNFYGIYSSYKGINDQVIDLYFLGFNDRGFFTNANGRYGDLNVYTIGSRFAGTAGNFDYDIEGGGQWGKWDGDEVHAWMFGSDAGYTFKNVSTTPRIGVGFDFATGDDTPRDGSHDTWNQLYPTGHAFLGYMDDVARANIISPNVNFSFKPVKDVTAKLTWYHFWLDSNLDALYNAGGVPIRRNVTGSSGNDVGDELDATVTWQIDVHSALLVGWSHFWPSNFVNSSGFSRDSDYVYLQYQFRF